MKRTLIAVAVVAIFIFALAVVWAGPGCSGCAKSGDASAKAVKCVVCSNAIDDPAKAPKSSYNGKAYYFCGSGCKAKFDKEPAKYAKPKVKSVVCPVMGKKIADISKAAGKSTYQGKTYYFCCTDCKTKFDKNPAKYAKSAKKPVSAVCPVMGNKIPDVSKAAGKSVYKGKTYYFCCAGCKPKFDADPQKYVGKK